MSKARSPAQIIEEMVSARQASSDREILTELEQLAPLPDEDGPAWKAGETWNHAYRFIAIADLAAGRKLKPAVRLLLDRACYGDPGEMMRGLRHSMEAIFDPDWSGLAGVCLEAAISERLGTRFWAIDQLMILDDPRARPIFENAVREGPTSVAAIAKIGIKRLGNA